MIHLPKRPAYPPIRRAAPKRKAVSLEEIVKRQRKIIRRLSIALILALAAAALLAIPAAVHLMETDEFVIGQNYGAGCFRRVRRVFFTCAGLAVASGLIFGWGMLLLREPLVALYLPDAPEVAPLAYERMWAAMAFYSLEGLMEALSGSLQGIKVVTAPTILMVGFICVFRLAWIFFIFPLEAFHSIYGLFLSYPISWGLTCLALSGMVAYYFKKKCPLSEDREGQTA